MMKTIGRRAACGICLLALLLPGGCTAQPQALVGLASGAVLGWLSGAVRTPTVSVTRTCLHNGEPIDCDEVPGR